MDDSTSRSFAEETLPGVGAALPGTRLNRISQMAGIGYWSVNRQTRQVRWSPEMRALHGLEDHEPVPRTADWLARFVHPDDRARTLELMRHWKRNPGQSMRHSLRVLRPDGSSRELLTHSLVEVEAGRNLAFGVVIDVTPMRVAELALHRAEGRAALTAHAVGLGTWENDLETDQVTWDDPMWLLRGLTPQPQPLDHESRLALLHPDDRERVRAINTRHVAATYEFRVIWPDGSTHWLAARSTTLHDDAGRPLRRIGINWDITAQRETEAALRAREMALRESHTQQRTLARMSHELRTPLNAILGCAQLLRDDPGAEPSVVRQRLGDIEAAGQQLLVLVNQVLDVATPAAERPRVPEPTVTARVDNGTPRRHTLLYIEDNAVNAMIVSELVARRGDLDMVVAETGLDGLRRAVELRPALVLLDMQLPDIDGTEVFARLRADPRTADLPCVALSANALKTDIDAALAAGMTDYWTKPLDFSAFARQLDAMFGPAPRH